MKNRIFAIIFVLIVFAAFPQTALAAGIPLKKVAFKFVVAMAAVVASSLILFVGLTLYNKFFKKSIGFKKKDKTDSLAAPKNLKDAILKFLERTNSEG